MLIMVFEQACITIKHLDISFPKAWSTDALKFLWRSSPQKLSVDWAARHSFNWKRWNALWYVYSWVISILPVLSDFFKCCF